MTDKPEAPSDVSPKDAKHWLAELSAAKKRMASWYEKAEEADERYRDEDESDSEFGSCNLLWANTETQKAAIGEDFGKPQVTRVNMPEGDGGLARHSAMVWERALAAAVKDTNDNHDIALAVGDVFLPGRGQVWIEVEEEGKWVRAPIVRVPYKDYLEGPATRWGSLPWNARAHDFTRDELVSECKMSEDRAAKVPLNVSMPGDDKSDRPADQGGQDQFKRARVWEIWAKYPEKGRIFVAEDYPDEVLRYDKDPLKLKGCFPCPRPLIANGDESKPPLTDFSRYQNQAEELDRICQRIFVLTECLRRTGIHDKQFKEIADLSKVEENTTLAVENWTDLQAKGGLNKIMEWQDLGPIVLVLVELHKQRDTLIRLIYELSGISDLARGHSDPDETATAQQLKATFGTSRFQRREKESRRFASEAYAIKGEVVAELFSREQLQEMSGMRLPLQKEIDGAKRQLAEMQTAYAAAQQNGQQLPPPNPDQIAHLMRLAQTRFSWEAVSGVLRSDSRRCYSVEVETDQTAFMDQEADKKARSEFFTTFMNALTQIGPMLAGNPKAGDVFKEMVMFVISAFKAGRGMEEGIERVIDEAIQKAAQQGQQQPQDPKAAADAQVAQARVQTAQVGLQTAQVRLAQAQVEAQRAGAEIQTEAAKTQLKGIEAQQKVKAQHDQNEAKRVGQEIDNIGKAEDLAFERATRATATEALLKGPTQAPPA